MLDEPARGCDEREPLRDPIFILPWPANTRSIATQPSGSADRFCGGAESAAARRGDGAAGAGAGDRGRGQRQDAHAHLSRRLSARKRRPAAAHPAAHLHEQGRARDARSRRERLSRTTSRGLVGRHVSLASAIACCAGIRTRRGSRRASRIMDREDSAGPARRGDRDARRRSEGEALSERRGARRRAQLRAQYGAHDRRGARREVSAFPRIRASRSRRRGSSYEARKKQANAMDFDDLLEKTLPLLQEPRGHRGALPAAVPVRARGRIPGHEPPPERLHRHARGAASAT